VAIFLWVMFDQLEMPTLRPGENYKSFKRRLNMVRAEMFANKTVDTSKRQNETSQLNPKRKEYVQYPANSTQKQIFETHLSHMICFWRSFCVRFTFLFFRDFSDT
jgi:hypothetical protein